MSKKEIITLVIAVFVIGASIYFAMMLLFPSKDTASNTTSQTAVQTVPAEVNDTTYKTINTLSDYGTPDPTGLGKADLFAGY